MGKRKTKTMEEAEAEQAATLATLNANAEAIKRTQKHIQRLVNKRHRKAQRAEQRLRHVVLQAEDAPYPAIRLLHIDPPPSVDAWDKTKRRPRRYDTSTKPVKPPSRTFVNRLADNFWIASQALYEALDKHTARLERLFEERIPLLKAADLAERRYRHARQRHRAQERLQDRKCGSCGVHNTVCPHAAVPDKDGTLLVVRSAMPPKKVVEI